MREFVAAATLTLLCVAATAPAANTYAAGQVWAYKSRPSDQGSLLKVQSAEKSPDGRQIYHISVIGIRFTNPQVGVFLPHSPVDRSSLDASVTKQVQTEQQFPDATAGIAEWRAAKGGVFTIPIAKIVELVDQQTAKIQ